MPFFPIAGHFAFVFSTRRRNVRFWGVKRTSRKPPGMSAYDPKRIRIALARNTPSGTRTSVGPHSGPAVQRLCVCLACGMDPVFRGLSALGGS